MADERFNADGLVRSEGYARTMAEAVLPRLRACRTDSTVPGAGGRRIVCISVLSLLDNFIILLSF